MNVLHTAANLLEGDRSRQHGDPRKTFATIADLWAAFLKGKLRPGETVTREDAALMMSLFKIARTRHGSWNADDYIDGAAYLQIAHDCSADMFDATGSLGA